MESKYYIMLFEINKFTVYPARNYQEVALDDYVKNNKTGIINYIADHNSEIKFSLSHFHYEGVGLEEEYKDFYHFTREDNIKYIMSSNKEKLESFCRYINRLSMDK